MTENQLASFLPHFRIFAHIVQGAIENETDSHMTQIVDFFDL